MRGKESGIVESLTVFIIVIIIIIIVIIKHF